MENYGIQLKDKHSGEEKSVKRATLLRILSRNIWTYVLFQWVSKTPAWENAQRVVHSVNVCRAVRISRFQHFLKTFGSWKKWINSFWLLLFIFVKKSLAFANSALRCSQLIPYLKIHYVIIWVFKSYFVALLRSLSMRIFSDVHYKW